MSKKEKLLHALEQQKQLLLTLELDQSIHDCVIKIMDIRKELEQNHVEKQSVSRCNHRNRTRG